jgi:hypothetical protein
MPNKEYYKQHKLKLKEYQQIRQQIYWSYVAIYKLLKGCKTCGFDAITNELHLHHRDPSTKLFSITFGYRYKESVYLAEINKCDVLCAPCHAKLHSRMRQEEKGRQAVKAVIGGLVHTLDHP